MSNSEPASVLVDAPAFDFRNPSTLSRDDSRALQLVQESLAHGVATALAAAVRASIDVQISSIEQAPHVEFVSQTPDPASLTLLRLGGLTNTAVLQIDPKISYSLVELLLGGPGNSLHPTRAHTELEVALLHGLVERFLQSIDEAFSPIVSVKSEISGHESNPAFLQVASATDMVVSVGIDIGVDALRGAMRLVIPVKALRPHLDARAAASDDAGRTERELQETRARVHSRLSQVDVVARVRFDPLVASSHQLLEMGVGDVIALDHGLNAPLVLEIDGVPIHDVTIGRVKGSLAVEVAGPAPSRPARPSRLRQASALEAGA